MSDAQSKHSRWILIASILGSGTAFLEATVVNVALPTIGRSFGIGVVGLEAVANGYALTLTALMLLGGALGDRLRRTRVFAIGLCGFALGCAGCAVAPNAAILVGCRVLQGVFAALLVPNSLAMLETAFTGEARGVAIGQWSAWSAVSTAIGPLLGGWLVDRVSWRWVFGSMIPFALAAAWIALRHGEAVERQSSVAPAAADGIDYTGAALITLALAGLVASLTLATTQGLSALVLGLGVGGFIAVVLYVIVERRSSHPLVPPSIFRSRVFTGANIVTLLVYAALSGLLFMLMLELQDTMGYSALAAGASLLPVNALMLLISPTAGRLAQRMGPRLPLTVGAFTAAAGMAMFARVRPGATYLAVLLPATLVFGLGLSILVAPLTVAVLGALDERMAGLASGVNNAVARLGGLLATAALPLAAGVAGAGPVHTNFAAGFTRGMWINAGVCATGGLVAWLALPHQRLSEQKVHK